MRFGSGRSPVGELRGSERLPRVQVTGKAQSQLGKGDCLGVAVRGATFKAGVPGRWTGVGDIRTALWRLSNGWMLGNWMRRRAWEPIAAARSTECRVALLQERDNGGELNSCPGVEDGAKAVNYCRRPRQYGPRRQLQRPSRNSRRRNNLREDPAMAGERPAQHCMGTRHPGSKSAP